MKHINCVYNARWIRCVCVHHVLEDVILAVGELADKHIKNSSKWYIEYSPGASVRGDLIVKTWVRWIEDFSTWLLREHDIACLALRPLGVPQDLQSFFASWTTFPAYRTSVELESTPLTSLFSGFRATIATVRKLISTMFLPDKKILLINQSINAMPSKILTAGCKVVPNQTPEYELLRLRWRSINTFSSRGCLVTVRSLGRSWHLMQSFRPVKVSDGYMRLIYASVSRKMTAKRMV